MSSGTQKISREVRRDAHYPTLIEGVSKPWGTVRNSCSPCRKWERQGLTNRPTQTYVRFLRETRDAKFLRRVSYPRAGVRRQCLFKPVHKEPGGHLAHQRT